MNLTPSQRAKIVKLYPQLAEFLEQKATNDLLTGLFSQITMVKGEKGDKGEEGKPGYTPIKGRDYFTDREIDFIISRAKELATPVKGKDYIDGSNYVLTDKDKREIAKSIDVPVIEKVIEKTETIKEVLPKLDVSMVKGAVSKKDLEAQDKKVLEGMALVEGRIKLVDQRYHGGGLKDAPADDKVYSRRDNAWVIEVTVSPTPPPNPYLNQLWYDTA